MGRGESKRREVWFRVAAFFVGISLIAGTVLLLIYLASPVVGHKEIRLMFANFGYQRLVPVVREVPREKWYRDPLKTTMQALFDGPIDNETLPVIPPGTRLLGSWRDGSTAWIDCDDEIFLGLSDEADAELLAVWGIVNTVKDNFPEIEQVQILINGSPRKTLRGLARITRPLVSRADLE